MPKGNVFNFKLYLACLGLPDKQLYPSVSAVYGNTEVSMVYLGAPLDGWTKSVANLGIWIIVNQTD